MSPLAVKYQARLAASHALRAALRCIRYAEGTGQTDDAFTTLFGGSHFEGFDDHPRIKFWEKNDEFIRNGKPDYTTAAGAFQITQTTWDGAQRKLGLPDFSPASQEIAAVCLIDECDALDDIESGRIEDFLRKCSPVWASLPYSTVGQPTRALSDTLMMYRRFLGEEEQTQPAAPIEERDMSGIPPRTEEAVSEQASGFDWGAAVKVGGAVASFFNPIVGAAITALSPLLQSKIETTLTKQTDPATAKMVATNLTDVIGKTLTRETGIADPFQAVVKMKDSPEVIAKVEAAVISRLDQMAPFLDKLHQQSKDEWAAEEESKNLAAQRVAETPLGPRIQYHILVFTLILLAVTFVFTGALIGWQMYLKEGSEPNGQLMILFVMLATMIANVYRTVADWGYGSSKNSAAKDLTISEFSKK